VNALFVAAADAEAFCRSHGWQSAVIGGLAVQRWGEPRQTRDVDLTLLTGLGGEARFVDALLDRYASRIPEARQFALDRRVVLVTTALGVPLDISLGGLPFEVRLVERATPFEFEPELAVTVCSAEDLLTLKAFADRPQDWIDIEGILVRQGAKLDRDLVFGELGPLLDLKEDTRADLRLRQLMKKHHLFTF
jgi:hypothetical protein